MNGPFPLISPLFFLSLPPISFCHFSSLWRVITRFMVIKFKILLYVVLPMSSVQKFEKMHYTVPSNNVIFNRSSHVTGIYHSQGHRLYLKKWTCVVFNTVHVFPSHHTYIFVPRLVICYWSSAFCCKELNTERTREGLRSCNHHWKFPSGECQLSFNSCRGFAVTSAWKRDYDTMSRDLPHCSFLVLYNNYINKDMRKEHFF